MSATAFVNTPKQTILLSDGLAVNVGGVDPDNDSFTYSNMKDRIVSRTQQKIFKVSPRAGVQWMGNNTTLGEKFIPYCQQNNLVYPKEVATGLGSFLREDMGRELDYYLRQPWWNLNIHISGYDRKEVLKGYQIASKTDANLNPSEPHTIKSNTIVCLAAFVERFESSKYLAEAIVRNKEGIFPNEAEAVSAFTDTMKYYRAKDMIFGGEIFSEVLTPG